MTSCAVRSVGGWGYAPPRPPGQPVSAIRASSASLIEDVYQTERAACSGRRCIECSRSVRGRTQLEALDLAGRRLRELADDLDPARVLVGREALLDERLELVDQLG